MTKLTNNKEATGILTRQRTKGWRETVQILMVLFKSRVVSLLLLAAIGGAFLGAGGWPGILTLSIVLFTGGLTASGSAGLNQYLERSSDATMRRTRRRPLVTGEVQPQWVLWASVAMVVIPPLLVLPFNPALTFWLYAGAVIYVGLYTILLKPRTLINIVIGGAAGSAAVLSGGAAAGNWVDPAVITLALLVFLWTPSHFWSLAILYREDYSRADVPMLPSRTSVYQAAWWVILHTGAASFAAIVLAFSPSLNLLYVVPVVIVSATMIFRNIRLIKDPSPKNARALFISSNIYLTVVLIAICAATLLSDI